jgi:hypothetical protein
VTELRDGGGVLFGMDRLRRLLDETAAASPMEVCDRLRRELDAFADPGQEMDDRTLLVLDVQERFSGSPLWRMIKSHVRKWRRSCPVIGGVTHRGPDAS